MLSLSSLFAVYIIGVVLGTAGFVVALYNGWVEDGAGADEIDTIKIILAWPVVLLVAIPGSLLFGMAYILEIAEKRGKELRRIKKEQLQQREQIQRQIDKELELTN